jgi:adenine deaminase
MLCSDDKHPDELLHGHINQLVKRAMDNGIDIFKVLISACVTPIKHYKLDVGLLQPGDKADFIVVDNLENLKIMSTYIEGKQVAHNGQALFSTTRSHPINNFNATPKKECDFIEKNQNKDINIIEAVDGMLFTNKIKANPKVVADKLVADISRDILKIVVLNRYDLVAYPSIAFIKGFGLKKGAMASSVAHDSHNIIAVGTNEKDLCQAVNLVIKHRGGLAVVDGTFSEVLPLPFAGILSDDSGVNVAEKYVCLDKAVKERGSTLKAPFMTLSFMALLVIPSLKISDKKLFDVERFQFTDLFCE